MKPVTAIVVVSLVALPLLAQYDKLIEDGKQSDLRGKTIKAANKYQQAATVATTPDQRVQALLSYTDAYRGARSNAQLAPAEASQIEAAFKSALPDATGALSFRVHNDYGVFLLERGDVTGAAKVFADGTKDLDGVPAAMAARYLYNFALAHQKAEQPKEALTAFHQALERDPSFALTGRALLSIDASIDAATGAQDAVGVATFLIDKQQFTQAGEALQRIFETEAWLGQAPDMESALSLFVRWAAEGDVPFETLAQGWPERLAHIADRASGSTSAKANELRHLFVRDLPPRFDVDVVSIFFEHWRSDSQRKNLAFLAASSADTASAAEWKQAFGMYVAAWQLDRENSDVLASMAELLKTNAKSEDGTFLLGQFTAELHQQKALARQAVDAPALLRLNMILGSIAESQDNWGPIDSPGTAAFHYSQALLAYELMREQNPKSAVYPGVYAHLAEAYQHIDRKGEAWKQYLAAANANLAIGNTAAADVMLGAANSLGYAPTPEEAAQLKQLTDRLAFEAPPVTVVSDADIVESVKQRLSAIPSVHGRDIAVASRGGVVTLTGDIPDSVQPYLLFSLKRAGSAIKEVTFAASPRE